MTSMSACRIFICSPDTGAGKTVVTALLAGWLIDQDLPVAALKPVCSGGRADGRLLLAACPKRLTLDEINPWHYREPIAPLLAARLEHRRLRLAQVVEHVRRVQRRFPVVIIEGAGGLLSPLGQGFNSRDLIVALRATPLVVCPNRLGAINQTLLVLDALPPTLSHRAQVALVTPPIPDSASRSNAHLLSELIGTRRIHIMPWVTSPRQPRKALENPRIRASIARLAAGLEVEGSF